ncbi:MAG: Small subunit (SSU) processome component [Alectoria sarmentosa]|nr:MAG: Small subunit (SSU) processome component [Alectoria sarmentosa]
MGNKRAPKAVACKASSVANPAASSNTQTASKSSILRSSFSPSHFQLSLFASVIQGLDAQHLRIHDTNTGRLRCEHTINSKASITCLEWGYYGENHRDRQHQESKKKRKRSDLVNGDVPKDQAGNVVVALGTSDSEVHMFSPSEAKIMGSLREAHTQGVRDFRFDDSGTHAEGWSIGGDGRLVQWDLKKDRVLRTIILPYGPANTLQPLQSSIICASHHAYILDPASKEQPPLFNASTNAVHSIIISTPRSSGATTFLTAAESDHFINVFNRDSPTLIGSLRTENEIISLDLYSKLDYLTEADKSSDLSARMLQPQQVLAAVNKDGVLEIFPEPFDFGSASSSKEHENLKTRMKQRTRKAAAQIRIRRPDKSSSIVPLLNASFQGSDIALAWAEGGVNLLFDTVRWRDEGTGNLLLKDMTDIVKAKSGAGVGAVVMNGVKDMGKSHIDESRTMVANGGDIDDVPMRDRSPEVIDISSGEEESEFEEESAPAQAGVASAQEGGKEPEFDADVEMGDMEAQKDGAQKNLDTDDAPGQDEEVGEPSFGDLMRANAPEAVDVQASFIDPNVQSLVPAGDRSLHQLPSGMSLGTVLTQSLRTNDTNLLETCLHVKDLAIVRATIERLDSSFATVLLQRLAERLHSRPGRAGSLMVWIQWTLVAHGGYLAGQPEVMKKLASLHRVVKDRANSLQSLLSLKGKLDMLEAQMNLRKSMQVRSRAANVVDEDDEQGVIYVEGQEESSSEEEGQAQIGEDPGDSPQSKARGKAQKKTDEVNHDIFDSDTDRDEDDSEDEPPTTMNGIADAKDEDSESEEEGLFDEEASSTDNDSIDEASEDGIDHDSIDTDSSDADTSPPPKRPANSKLSNGI